MPASIPIIGCGGITSGEDALEYAKAGATTVQLYTAFGYDGVGACRRIKDQLAEALAREGTTWQAVVNEVTENLSAKPGRIAEAEATKASRAESDSGLQTLIDEALSIKSRLEELSDKFGQEHLAETIPPNNSLA